jgi:hypothetical protein
MITIHKVDFERALAGMYITKKDLVVIMCRKVEDVETKLDAVIALLDTLRNFTKRQEAGIKQIMLDQDCNPYDANWNRIRVQPTESDFGIN